MIRVKMLPKNEVCVIDNGKSYLFNLSGLCYKEDASLIPKYTTGMLELPIISILSSNNKVDIAVFCNNGVEMKRYITDKDAMTCAMTLQMKGGFVRMLRRDGMQDNIRFNQLLFVYKEGTSLNGLITELNAREVTD